MDCRSKHPWFTNTEMSWSVRMSAHAKRKQLASCLYSTAPEESPSLEASSDQEEFSSLTKTIELDPVACKPVAFELHEIPPGVPHAKDGEQNWTPFVRRRERKNDRL